MQARSTVADLAKYAHDKFKGTNLKLAFDEYNYWYGPHVFGELGTRYFHKDGLGIAAALHEMFRNSDVYEMALYAQTVNVIGALNATRTTSFFDSTGLVLKEYRRLFGTLPVAVTGGGQMADVVAAWSADKKRLTIAAINPLEEAQKVTLSYAGAELDGRCRRYRMASTDPDSFNSSAEPTKLKFVEEDAATPKGDVTLPAYSVTLWVVGAW
jgi:alpha-N-arabinofuranosidase